MAVPPKIFPIMPMPQHFIDALKQYHDDMIDAMNYGITGFVYDKPQIPEWQTILKEIPSLEGCIIGMEVVVPEGHKSICETGRYKKKNDKIKFVPDTKTQGQIIHNNQGFVTRLNLSCTCGWDAGDITELSLKNQGKYGVLSNLFVSHLKMPFEEVDYIVFTQEWIEDMSRDDSAKLLRFIQENKGVLQRRFDNRDFILVDDAMSDDAIAELSKMLEGHELSKTTLKVYKELEK